MSKRRTRKRKRNPTTAQWAVVGIGGAVGLGLLGYGISVVLKNRKEQKALTPDGAGFSAWQYTVKLSQSGGTRSWTPTVYQPGGINPQELPSRTRKPDAEAVAREFIAAQGGVPVYRELGTVVNDFRPIRR